MLYPKIRELRILHDLKQEYVADQLGMSQPEYSRMENGHRHARIEDFRKLGKMYDVSISSLMLKEQEVPYGSRQHSELNHMPNAQLSAHLAQQEAMIAHLLQRQNQSEHYLREILRALGREVQTVGGTQING